MFRNLWKAIEAVIQRSQESQAKTCNEVLFLVKLEARTKYKTLLQLFSSEFLKVFQNSYSAETCETVILQNTCERLTESVARWCYVKKCS